ncbi:MAG: hypothetical protein FWD66_05895 [Paludibacter sp.]|nr:hypothetical protein [Paludibacter sp.]
MSNNNGEYTDINEVSLCFVDTARSIQKHFETKFCTINVFVSDTTLTDSILNRLGKKTTGLFELLYN